MLESNLIARIAQLIAQAPELQVEAPQVPGTNLRLHTPVHRAECAAWLAAAFNAVCHVLPWENHPYRRSYDAAVWMPDGSADHYKAGRGALLQQILTDHHQHLLGSVADRASGETFDDLLDHAQAYLDEGRKDGSGILAAAVFEDTLKRIARKAAPDEELGKADQVISLLQKVGTLNGIDAKRCRVAAGVRNAALHADWDEYTLETVAETIRLTRQLIERHLSG